MLPQVTTTKREVCCAVHGKLLKLLIAPLETVLLNLTCQVVLILSFLPGVFLFLPSLFNMSAKISVIAIESVEIYKRGGKRETRGRKIIYFNVFSSHVWTRALFWGQVQVSDILSKCEILLSQDK